MLKNYLVIAWRNLRRHKGYAFINVFGLALGIACFLLVVLYLQHQLSFDNFHAMGDRIYRVVGFSGFAEKSWNASTSGRLAPELRSSFAGVADAVRMKTYSRQWIKSDGELFQDINMIHCESNIFNIFSFELLAGDPATALDRPNTAVITQSHARRLFGSGNPIGRVLQIEHNDTVQPFEITGLMADVPRNSHFSFDMLLSFESLLDTRLSIDANQFTTYVLLRNESDPAAVARQIQSYVHDTLGKEYVADSRLQPLGDIYFSDIHAPRQGDIRYSLVLSAIAVLILAIACVNYMSLASARSAGRTQEVGIRKVLGAQRRQLIGQFLTETWLITLTALPVALLLLKLALPHFNALVQTEMAFVLSDNAPFVGVILAALALISLVAGSYPALFLSAFQPIAVMRGRIRTWAAGALLRRLMVVFQFSVAIALMACTGIIVRQLNFMQARSPGFDTEQIVLVRLDNQAQARQAHLIKLAFRQQASVRAASAAGYGVPGLRFGANRFIARPQGKDGPAITFATPAIDADFLETMGISLIAGRNVTDMLPEAGSPEALINETAVAAMGLARPEEALGQEIAGGRIVGVVRDFNFASFREAITPLMMKQNQWGSSRFVAVRLGPGNTGEALRGLAAAWAEFSPDMPFAISFLSDELNTLYVRERRNAEVFGTFAGLAIVIACLGLFGLSAFIADQRTREIGVRKVLGASVADILLLLSRNHVLLVLIAFVVAAPAVYWAMARWLAAFAYRVGPDPGVFVLSGGAAILIALLSMGVQSLRAALRNPVDTLRQE